MSDKSTEQDKGKQEWERLPGVRILSWVRWGLLLATILAAVGSWWSYAQAQRGSTATTVQYQCPMHPQILQDRPGECPICHMNLEVVSSDRLQKNQEHSHQASHPSQAPSLSSAAPTHPSSHSSTPASSSSASQEYICTMCPEVHSDKPGRCPKCGMDLVLAPKAQPASGDHPAARGRSSFSAVPTAPATALNAPHSQAAVASSAGGMPVGTTPLWLSLDRVQAIGVRTALVEEQTMPMSVRATAVVSAPEQNVAEVHVRTAGFVEGISVRETGVKVKAGQALVSVYSPEIYQAQSELLATKDWAPLGGPGSTTPAQAARRKLELLGVSSKVAEKVIASGKPLRAIGVSAPLGGVITKKNVVLGSYVTPETTLYEIVDLSKVYVLADLFQQDVGKVSVGTVGRFASGRRKEAIAEAKVDLIYPQVSLEARTTRVRLQVENSKLGLLPGEYGTVEFQGEPRSSLFVPRDALIDTGEQVYVFLEQEPGHFVPRTVVAGSDAGDRVEILAGVQKGERIVSGATFLLDSESRLQASLAAPSTLRQ